MKIRRLKCRVRVIGARGPGNAFRSEGFIRPEFAFATPPLEIPTIAEEEVPESADLLEERNSERPEPRDIADRVYELAKREIERTRSVRRR